LALPAPLLSGNGLLPVTSRSMVSLIASFLFPFPPLRRKLLFFLYTSTLLFLGFHMLLSSTRFPSCPFCLFYFPFATLFFLLQYKSSDSSLTIFSLFVVEISSPGCYRFLPFLLHVFPCSSLNNNCPPLPSLSFLVSLPFLSVSHPSFVTPPSNRPPPVLTQILAFLFFFRKPPFHSKAAGRSFFFRSELMSFSFLPAHPPPFRSSVPEHFWPFFFPGFFCQFFFLVRGLWSLNQPSLLCRTPLSPLFCKIPATRFFLVYFALFRLVPDLFSSDRFPKPLIAGVCRTSSKGFFFGHPYTCPSPLNSSLQCFHVCPPPFFSGLPRPCFSFNLSGSHD